MNKRFIKWILQSIIAFLFTTSVYSSIPNHDDNKTTWLGPSIQGRYTIPLLNTTTPFFTATGVSVLGEAGPKNLRVGGTVGFGIDCIQRVKFSAEYLWQRLNYSFFSGNKRKWVEQGAIGGTYQIDLFEFYHLFLPQFDLNAYYSHAPNKQLSTVNGTFIDRNGDEQSFTEERRIAGSDAYGISPGIRIQPWVGSQLRAFLNYDNVRYHKRFDPNEDAIGFGGTIGLNQTFFCHFNVDLFASVRKPFNEYGGSINYLNLPFYGLWTLGIFGNYTDGKHTLPNSYNVGLGINYFVEPCCLTPPPVDYKNEHSRVLSTPDPLVNWLAEPAVYMPQVLAVADSRVTILTPIGCTDGLVTLLNPIPDQPTLNTTGGDATTTIATGSFFGGNNKTFSVTHTTDFDPNSSNMTEPIVTIDSNTGLVTVTAFSNTAATIFVTVTASNNNCGSASSTFSIPVQGD